MKRVFTSMSIAAALAAAGCASSSTPTAGPAPTTVPAAQEKAMVTPAPTGAPMVAKPAIAPVKTTTGQAPAVPTVVSPKAPVELPATSMTHSFTKDTPYFAHKPGKGGAPDGTFKAGTKVLVMIPGAPYSKVMSQDGVSAYASIDDLEPLGK